jgi:protocatechuate 3,4-dioxygenase beta subunit
VKEKVMPDFTEQTRRKFLLSGAAAGGLAAAPDFSFAQQLSPTPECKDGHEPTQRQSDGPFYKPRSPQRADLREPGSAGRAMELSGLVLTRSCKPVAGALVDLWHADEKGDYDNSGFHYRGHQFTDAQGRYTFRTIMPAVYTGRTRHFHVKVQAPNRPILTTQLYFSDEAQNRRDGMFRRELLMRMENRAGEPAARFDFMLDLA